MLRGSAANKTIYSISSTVRERGGREELQWPRPLQSSVSSKKNKRLTDESLALVILSYASSQALVWRGHIYTTPISGCNNTEICQSQSLAENKSPPCPDAENKINVRLTLCIISCALTSSWRSVENLSHISTLLSAISRKSQQILEKLFIYFFKKPLLNIFFFLFCLFYRFKQHSVLWKLLFGIWRFWPQCDKHHYCEFSKWSSPGNYSLRGPRTC